MKWNGFKDNKTVSESKMDAKSKQSFRLHSQSYKDANLTAIIVEAAMADQTPSCFRHVFNR